jgi:2-phosphoxylose phosphatase
MLASSLPSIADCFTSFDAFTTQLYQNSMVIRLSDALLWGAAVTRVAAQSNCSTPTSVDLTWHAPNATDINNLAFVVNGTGIDGFIFNSSITPATTSYSTYNWCNMPHVRRQEYPTAASGYKLKYVELIHRHHKRTPYAANTFPRESYAWNCDDEALFFYGTPRPDGTSAQVNWQVFTSMSNPLAPEGFNGTCQFPQISGSGLNDSRQHGKDLFGVYHDLLKFLPSSYNSTAIKYRVTNNVITSQVAGQIVEGQYPQGFTDKPISVLIQPDSIDSLEPAYTCSAASSLYSSYGVGSSVANWTLHLNDSVALYAKLDSVSGVNTTDPDWHNWFDHYFDNLSARLCHQKPLPCEIGNSSNCVTQADANAVFRRGQYEYSFIYRDSPASLAASTGSFGIWMAELASNMRAAVNGTSGTIYRHNVAHDGSVSRLLSILQIDKMVWPGMGSEVVFELYEKSGCYFLRVLWGGQILRSSNPSLGLMDMVPVQTFLGYVDGLVGVGASKIPSLCSA